MKRRNLIHNLNSETGRRRRLRREGTLAERILWANLRARRLDGRKFRRQYGIGPFIADFYCPECRVIVELDGAGHMDPIGAARDGERSRFLARFGIEVLRFENKEVLQGLPFVLETIRTALKRRDQDLSGKNGDGSFEDMGF